jgi:hypothetical protein
MKKLFVTILALLTILETSHLNAFAGEMDILLRKLVEKGVLTQKDADDLKVEAKAEAEQEAKAAKEKAAAPAPATATTAASTLPSWAQNVTLSGDVAFRTHTDWGKTNSPAHQRIRERVKARLGVEAKVNDQVTAGMLAVTGTNSPRARNQTLENNFETADLRIDAYYIKWTPALPADIGKGNLLLGKFQNPLTKTDMLWDNNICPGGINARYETPAFDIYDISSGFYSNMAMLWVDEIQTSERDPMLWVGQLGLKMNVIPEWQSAVDASLAYYDFANIRHNSNFRSTTPVGGSQTNDIVTSTSEYMYDFNLIDFILKYDSLRFFDFKLGHGLYSDIIVNAGPADSNLAYAFGGYLGEQSPKEKGAWKLFGNWKYTERNAVPDFMPDIDFYGFNYIANASVAGWPSAGGTNGEGVTVGADYAIFKNTVIGGKYAYMWPITVNRSANYTDEAHQLMQLDVRVKF